MEIPKGGLMGKTVRAVKYLGSLRIGLYASHASFFIVLSVFPGLAMLLSLLRYTGVDVNNLLTLLEGFIPGALMPAAKKLVLHTYTGTSGALISVSVLTALWSSSRGIYGLLNGLNTVYEVQESRGWLYTRSVSVFYTFIFLIVLLVTLALNILGGGLLDFLPLTVSVFNFLNDLLDLQFVFLLLLQTGVFTAMYMALPNHRNKFLDSLPGAVLSSLCWQLFSHIYSYYMEYLTVYTSIYGSVYFLALSMLWLYFCVSILFYGGVLNNYLIKRKK